MENLSNKKLYKRETPLGKEISLEKLRSEEDKGILDQKLIEYLTAPRQKIEDPQYLMFRKAMADLENHHPDWAKALNGLLEDKSELEIAKELGVSRTRVNQERIAALKFLKKALNYKIKTGISID